MTTIPIACIAVSLWIRRETWRCQNEAALTLALALFASSFILCTTTATNTVGIWLRQVFGVWHIEDFIGHVAFLIAIAAGVYYTLERVADDEYLHQAFKQWIEYPLTLLVPIMFGTYVQSATTHVYSGLLTEAANDGWMTAYRLMIYGAVIYLTGYGVRVTMHLRRVDPPSRLVADLLTVGGALAIASCLFGIVATIPVLHVGSLDTVAILLMYLGVSLGAVTAAASWIVKQWPHRKLRRSLRGRGNLVLPPPPHEPHEGVPTA